MVKIKLKIGAGEAKSGPPLAPILGQHQVNLMEFCKLFNAKSLEVYSQGVPVRMRLYKGKGSIRYDYKPLTSYSLLMNFALYINKGKFVTYSQLYDIFKIRKVNLEKLNISGNDKQIAKQLFGFLSSASFTLKK